MTSDSPSNNKWHKRFLYLAKEISYWSKDPSTQVGAIIAKDKHILGYGYNGFPPTCPDDNHLLYNRDTKLKLIIHAEVNAVLNSKGADLSGSILYTYPLFPCPDCAKFITATAIDKVYSWNTNLHSPFLKYLNDTRYIFEMNNMDFHYIDNIDKL